MSESVNRAPAAGSRPPSALPVGTRLGEFELRKVLGVGGFGIVYLAFDHALEREVALKEYMPQSLVDRTATLHVSLRSAADEETFALGLRSFVNEARMLAHFDHPSLLKVHRFWEANGTAYMAMPLYRGRTLKDVMQQPGHVTREAWLREMLQPLLGALELMHSEGTYHRDISPDNILLEADGRPVLLDFGAARRVLADRSQTLTAILKPSYAPIEQYAETSAIKQGPWTDIYALGATLHYLMLGRPPPPATTRAIEDEMVPLAQQRLPGFNTAFLAVVDWMLAPRPADRVPSVAVLRDAFEGRVVPPHDPDATVPQRPAQVTRPAPDPTTSGRFNAPDMGTPGAYPGTVRTVPTAPHPAADAQLQPPDSATVMVPRKTATEPYPATHVATQPATRMQVTGVVTGRTEQAGAAGDDHLVTVMTPRRDGGSPATPAAAAARAAPPAGEKAARRPVWLGVGALVLAVALAGLWYGLRGPSSAPTQQADTGPGLDARGLLVSGAAASGVTRSGPTTGPVAPAGSDMVSAPAATPAGVPVAGGAVGAPGLVAGAAAAAKSEAGMGATSAVNAGAVGAAGVSAGAAAASRPVARAGVPPGSLLPGAGNPPRGSVATTAAPAVTSAGAGAPPPARGAAAPVEPLAGLPGAAAPTPVPSPASGDSPGVRCGGRAFLSLFNCMRNQCNNPQWREHPECTQWRTDLINKKTSPDSQ